MAYSRSEVTLSLRIVRATRSCRRRLHDLRAAAGVLHVRELITDSRSLLYAREGIDSLGRAIERAIALLDPTTSRQ